MSDVYLYGMITPSIVHILRRDFEFPKANGYAEIGETLMSVGGEAANSAVMLAKLGLSVQLDGNWLNRRRADHVIGLLGPFGIDLSRLTLVDSGGTDEFVIADRLSRTVFGNYATFHDGPRQWNEPQPADIQAAKIVCVDPYFHDESRRVAELCVALGKPYVTLDCECDDPIARNAAAVVISHELRDRVYLAQDQREVFERYQSGCRGLVIFTFGQAPLWYGRHGEALRQHQPYAIEPVDTTGAGDAFRGAIAYGLLKGYEDEKTVDFASAVAANVCLSYPHALSAPGLDAILAFIAKYRTDSVTVP
jgi:sugar/nucleoside kinase (ribokinase family)